MPPLRKTDRRSLQQRVESQPMTEIRMSVNSTDTTLVSPDNQSGFEQAPSSHPVYGAYRELQPPTPVMRPGMPDNHSRTLSDLMTESIQNSPMDTPNGGSFPLFAPRATSSYSEAGTRSSSPYPSPYPASTPFVSSLPLLYPGLGQLLTIHSEVKKLSDHSFLNLLPRTCIEIGSKKDPLLNFTTETTKSFLLARGDGSTPILPPPLGC